MDNIYIPPVFINDNKICKSEEYTIDNENQIKYITNCNRQPIVNWDIHNNWSQYKSYLVLGPQYCHHTYEKPFNNQTKRRVFYDSCDPRNIVNQIE